MKKAYSWLLDLFIPIKEKLTEFVVWYFFFGMLYIHVRATFLPYEQTVWDDLYYIWNNGLFLLLFILVRCLVVKKYRFYTNTIIFYSLIRLLWEVASPITNLWEINHPQTVTILFSILLIGGIVLLWKEIHERKKQEN